MTPSRPPPFSYPRAGREGTPLAAEFVRELILDLLAEGVPPSAIGPTLVRGYADVYRRLPTATPGVDKSQVPMLYSLLGSGTAPLKMSKRDSAYQGEPVGDQRCENCSSSYRNVVSDEVICSQVEGEIDLAGWCRIWNTDRF